MASTVGSPLSRNAGLLAFLTVGAMLQPVACDEPAGSGLPDEAMALALEPIAVQIGEELAAFQVELAALDAALATWQTALDTTDGAAELDVARGAWADAMATWQRLELYQIGPLGSSLSTVGGEDLRDEAYSWPDTVSGCRVDTETVEAVWDQADFFTANFVNSYGLDALEHLLFAPLTTECPAQVDIQTQWDALGDAGIQANRAGYARALVGHLDGLAADLEARWADELGPALVQGEAPWATRSESLTAVYHALYYLETGTKDRKLAEPLGLRDCTADCAVLVESQRSGHGAEWIVANLSAAHRIVVADDDNGLDALLVEVGHADLAVAVDQALVDAIAAAETLDGPLDVAIAEDPAAVQAVHDAVKVATDLIRGDLATVLLLEIPAEAAGDND